MEKKAEAVERRLGGETQQQIADALGISRQRVQQLFAESLADGRFSVHIEVTGAENVTTQALTIYLHEQLNAAGVHAK